MTNDTARLNLRRAARSARGGGWVHALILVGAAAFASAVRAQPPDPAVELHVDFFRADFDSSVRFDSRTLGLGTDLDLERDLGIESEADIVRGELHFRAGKRSRITVDYLSMSRDGRAVVGRQFQFGDYVFDATADVESSVDTEFAAIGWRFDVVQTNASRFGFSLSVANLSFDAAVKGPVSVAGVGSTVIEEKGSVDGPLPMLGLHWSTWLGERFRLSASGRYLEIDDLDGWSGSAVDAGVRLDWFVTSNFGVGIGYSTTQLEAENVDPAKDGLTKADSSFDGFRAGLTLAF